MAKKGLENTIFASQAFTDAVNYRETMRHEFVLVEHLLLAITQQSQFQMAYALCGGKTEELQAELTRYLEEEVEKVLPEAVTADENGMLLVNYETLTVFLIEAVKEQRKEIQRIQQILEKHGLNE